MSELVNPRHTAVEMIVRKCGKDEKMSNKYLQFLWLTHLVWFVLIVLTIVGKSMTFSFMTVVIIFQVSS